MSKSSMKEDGVRREEVQDPLTEASRHEANQPLNETSSEMAFLHSERCAGVLWQWFCWWSGVALPRQGINVYNAYELNIPNILSRQWWQIPPCRACSIQGASLPYSKFFFRHPILNHKTKIRAVFLLACQPELSTRAVSTRSCWRS